MWPNPQFTTDLLTFTEEILNGKLHFMCSVTNKYLRPYDCSGSNFIAAANSV